jgi:hypothetical protein
MGDEEEHVPMVEGGGGVLGAEEPEPTPSKSEASKRAAAAATAARRGGARGGASSSSSSSSSGPGTTSIMAIALLVLGLVAAVFYSQSLPAGGGGRMAAHSSALHTNASSLAAAAAALAAAADQLAAAASVGADGSVDAGAPGARLAPGELSLLPALTASLPLKPEMTPAEVSLLARSLLASSHVWEWGCGGSTALAAFLGNIRSIRSVDSLAVWRNRVLNATAPYAKRVHIVLVDLGRTKAWGWPADEASRPKWPAYPQTFRDRAAVGATAAADDGDGADGSDDANPPLPPLPDPDFVLVDGRFRVACALEVLLSGTRPLVAIHDWDRDKYHVILPFFDVVEVAGRMAVLRPRHEWDEPAARAMYDTYLGRPD